VKILIVDDDVVSRMVLMHLVDGALGGRCVVLEAEDGEDAWSKLDAGDPPAMVFCDLRMPRLSGLELLARIKADARFAALPFVLASAAGDAATMQQALGLGAHGVIVKPFDGAVVAAQLAGLAAPAGPDTRDEEPLASARRLGIGVERLQVYLGGLERQLGAAGADVDALLAAGQPDAARAVLGRLAEGCRTLGLHGAAEALARAPAQAREAGAALADARAAVLRQAEAARRLRTGADRA
jgi:two-component system chemotaxis response regulator CheY